MSKKVLFLGLEVDDKSFHAAALGEQSDLIEFQCKPRVDALLGQLKKLTERGYELKICYEATYVGFSLCRNLREKGFDCEIVAPSLIPQTPGPRVKTDRLDCIKLARYYQGGLLTTIHIPHEEEECDRDLLRTRDFIVRQIRSTKLYLLAHCRRRGWDYRQACGKAGAHFWTKEHREWLNRNVASSPYRSLQVAFKIQLLELAQLEQQVVALDLEIQNLAKSERYQKQVQALICYRGIQTHTAMTWITEIGDIQRFVHPSKIVSYVGLDLSEYSSGASQRRYHITKMGNAYMRTALIEIAQHVALPPRVSRTLKDRRKNIEEPFISVADRCMNRLHKRYHHLTHRGKPSNVAKVACARELVGFLWESLRVAEATAA